ncbi:hypothetical protein DFJ73DRAFT_798994 [Zopfochytrium polystomum]|nr:hypothetical protein DFJ73DRAFT_798994 [Zopfochytrium polystomum]
MSSTGGTVAAEGVESAAPIASPLSSSTLQYLTSSWSRLPSSSTATTTTTTTTSSSAGKAESVHSKSSGSGGSEATHAAAATTTSTAAVVAAAVAVAPLTEQQQPQPQQHPPPRDRGDTKKGGAFGGFVVDNKTAADRRASSESSSTASTKNGGSSGGGHGSGDEEDLASIVSKLPPTVPWNSRRRIRHFISRESFHHTIIGLVLFDLLLVFVDLILAISAACTPAAPEADSGSTASNSTTAAAAAAGGAGKSFAARAIGIFVETVANATSGEALTATCTPKLQKSHSLEIATAFLFWLSVTLLVVFALEVLVSVYAKGLRYLKAPITFIDAVIVYASLFMELYFHFSGMEESSAGAVVVLRIWKIVRAMHAIAHSVAMKNQAIIKSVQKSNRIITNQTEEMIVLFERQRRVFVGLKKALLSASSNSSSSSFVTEKAGGAEKPAMVTVGDLRAAETAAATLALTPSTLAATLRQVFATLESQMSQMRRAVDHANQEELHEALALTDEAFGLVEGIGDNDDNDNDAVEDARSQRRGSSSGTTRTSTSSGRGSAGDAIDVVPSDSSVGSAATPSAHTPPPPPPTQPGHFHHHTRPGGAS